MTVKRADKRGQPCLTERFKGTMVDLSLLVKIEHIELAYIRFTQDINDLQNPNLYSDSNMSALST